MILAVAVWHQWWRLSPLASIPQSDGEVEKSRRVDAHSENTCVQTRVSMQMFSAAAVGAPLGVCLCSSRRVSADSVESEEYRAAFFHAWIFLLWSDTAGHVASETATEQSILEIASGSRESKRQQQSFQPSLHLSRCQRR